MPVNMTGYPSIRKTAHHGPALAELEFARDKSGIGPRSWQAWVVIAIYVAVVLGVVPILALPSASKHQIWGLIWPLSPSWSSHTSQINPRRSAFH